MVQLHCKEFPIFMDYCKSYCVLNHIRKLRDITSEPATVRNLDLYCVNMCMYRKGFFCFFFVRDFKSSNAKLKQSSSLKHNFDDR